MIFDSLNSACILSSFINTPFFICVFYKTDTEYGIMVIVIYIIDICIIRCNLDMVLHIWIKSKERMKQTFSSIQPEDWRQHTCLWILLNIWLYEQLSKQPSFFTNLNF